MGSERDSKVEPWKREKDPLLLLNSLNVTILQLRKELN